MMTRRKANRLLSPAALIGIAVALGIGAAIMATTMAQGGSAAGIPAIRTALPLESSLTMALAPGSEVATDSEAVTDPAQAVPDDEVPAGAVSGSPNTAAGPTPAPTGPTSGDTVAAPPLSADVKPAEDDEDDDEREVVKPEVRDEDDDDHDGDDDGDGDEEANKDGDTKSRDGDADRATTQDDDRDIATPEVRDEDDSDRHTCRPE